ncbi:MAG: cupin domain-containing protein [Candidatus Heimdallarchaeota archaeon]|nr:cupin domain-containing protein [Candidatus Heimdallarchaeota archaeon]
MRQGKNWGYTTEIFRNAMVSAYHLEINEGGYCSEHRHKHKYNMFYILSGVLELTIWRDKKTKDVTIIEAGQSTAISPGFYHKFKGITKCEAIEIYQVLLIEPDIERRTIGGMEKK